MILGAAIHSANTFTRSEAADASGGQVVTYTARDEDIPCLVRGASSSEKMLWMQQNISISHVIAATWSDWRTGDKVTTGGYSLRVVGIRPQQGVGNIPTWYEITLEELK
jgi:hypothetical protein